jgi:hypothetical protein
MQSFIGILETMPTTVVPADHIGARRPSATADLPSVVVAATEVRDTLAGIGGVVATTRLSQTAWTSTSATRSSGLFALELWAGDDAAIGQLAEEAFQALEGPPESLSAAGFLRLAVTSVGPIEQAALGVTGSDTALRLPIGCSFAFEAVTPEDIGPDGIIKHVHVEMKDEFDEVMDLPMTPN